MAPLLAILVSVVGALLIVRTGEGWGAIYGLVSCAAIIVVSKLLALFSQFALRRLRRRDASHAQLLRPPALERAVEAFYPRDTSSVRAVLFAGAC